MEQAAGLARRGRLVTFGIRPERAETGYGYIEAEGGEVLRFVEKPDAATAEAFLASGRFLWNAGMFCFEARTMIGHMERFCPDILAGCRESLSGAHRAGGRIELEAASFAAVRATSVDQAVLEKAPGVAVVPCDIGWGDIGCWASLGASYPADENGNRALGDATAIGARNNVVHGGGRTIGLLGVEGLVIADTPDALLVAAGERAQDVQLVYEQLRDAGDGAHSSHRTVRRPWGAYTVLEEGARFKVKRLEVAPGAQLSLQMHRHRAEHWVVVSGTARVVNGEREMTLHADQGTYIAYGTKHRLDNLGPETLVLIEVQTGAYLGEDDIVRYEDVYGRD